HGAAGTCLVDVGPFAHTDLQRYRDMAEFLNGRGLPAPDISAATSVEEVLSACGARYEIEGLASLRRLPDQSFDFIFSNSVLQYPAREQMLNTVRELRRLLRPDGVSVHSIDLRDMMGQSLHH